MEDTKIIRFKNNQGQEIKLKLVGTMEDQDNKYAFLTTLDNDDEAYIYRIERIDNKDEWIIVDEDLEFQKLMNKYEELFN